MICKHKNTRIHHHSTEHNKPLCANIVMCKDCGEILRLDSISLITKRDALQKGDVE